MILINLCGQLDMAGAAILKISRVFAVWRKLIFPGALPLVQWTWRKMSTQNRKSVLTIIGSTSSVKARSDEAVYVATKHAQAGLARSLGMQADEQKLPVRVALFLPGAMKTPFGTVENFRLTICFLMIRQNCHAYYQCD